MLQYLRTGSRFLAFFVVVACNPDAEDGLDADTGPTTGTTGTTSTTSTTSASGPSTQASAASSSLNTSSSTATTATTTGEGTTSDSGGAGGSGGSGGSDATGGSGGNPFGAGGFPDTTTEGTTTTTGASTGGSGGCVPAVDCEPEVLPSSGDFHEDCVNRVNQFRVGCWCLPALERWTEGEACADEHAQYDSEQDEAHAGFGDGICENGGNGQNECPGWGSEPQIIEGCLQMMYDEGPPPGESCNDQCFQEHGHFINMTNENYSRVACGFYTTPGGDVWSVQNFR